VREALVVRGVDVLAEAKPAPLDFTMKDASGKDVTLASFKGKVLLVDAPFTTQATRAIRNLERVTLQVASKLNTLDLVQYTKIVVSSQALEQIIARTNGGQS